MPNSMPTHSQGIPLAVAQVTLLLLRRAVEERTRMIKLNPRDQKLGLWLMPDGTLKYRRTRVAKKRAPQPLLIHHVDHRNNPVNSALISRLIAWLVDANLTALPDMLPQGDLRQAFEHGFFQQIGDEKGHAQARLAVADEVKRKLIAKHIQHPQPGASGGD